MPLSSPIASVAIRTPQRVAEISWFDDLCGGDTQYLSVLDGAYRSSWAHCRDITLAAERLRYSNILLPTSYTVGQDVMTFAAGIAPQTSRINLLTAIRTGEIHPPMLARALASLDHMLEGRLTINIINSDLPGLREVPELRYQRCAETIEILRQAWTQERIVHKGELYQFDMPSDPAKPYQQNGGPLLYVGGTSEGARAVCAQYCDMFLMWPETEEMLYETMQDLSARAARHGRQIDFGLRIHVIVRETEDEARAYARKLMSKFDPVKGAEIKSTAKTSCASTPTTRASWSRCSGPISARPARARAARWSAPPTKSWRSSTATWIWASGPSSSRATRCSTRPIILPATYCHACPTSPCPRCRAAGHCTRP
jgi:alkanesulfonate monooxygenase